MAENPIRVAFCPLLFSANGGEFDQKGRPIFRQLQEARKFIRGKCDEAYDCGECELLVRWCNERAAEGFHIGWECVHCLKETKAVPRWTPKFYQSSKYRGPPEDRDLVEPDRSLDGCTRCGWGSMVLQLVLRK